MRRLRAQFPWHFLYKDKKDGLFNNFRPENAPDFFCHRPPGVNSCLCLGPKRHHFVPNGCLLQTSRVCPAQNGCPECVPRLQPFRYGPASQPASLPAILTTRALAATATLPNQSLVQDPLQSPCKQIRFKPHVQQSPRCSRGGASVQRGKQKMARERGFKRYLRRLPVANFTY